MITETYNRLKQGKHTAGQAFCNALNSKDAEEKLAYTMIALAVNAKVITHEQDQQTIAQAMIKKIMLHFDQQQETKLFLSNFQRLLESSSVP